MKPFRHKIGMIGMLLTAGSLLGILAGCAPTDDLMARAEKNEKSLTRQAPYGKGETEVMKSITLTKLTTDVWLHQSMYEFPGGAKVPSNGLVVRDGDELILIDTPWGEMATQILAKKLKKETDLKIKSVIITHFHYDRLAGVDWLEAQGAIVYTHPKTPLLAASQGIPVPDTSVAALGQLGARTAIGPIELAYPGPAHTEDNLIVYIHGDDILYGGCMVRSNDQKSLGNLTDADLNSWPTSLQWVRAIYKDARIVVPGHGKLGDTSLLSHTAALLSREINSKAKSGQTANKP